MASANAVIRRALLYVPASSQKMLDKSRSLSVDCVVYDLEDSVTLARKPEARSAIRRFLEQPPAPGIKEQAVRINSVESGLALDDLSEVLKAPNVDTLVLPKCQSASDLRFVSDVIQRNFPDRHPYRTRRPRRSDPSPPLKILALIESAQALSNLNSICAITPGLLQGLIFAAEDFALDLSLTRTPSLQEFLYARSAIVTAARAYNLPSAIDLVCTSYKGDEGLKILEEECLGGKGLGFNGKQLIHPSQVEVCQKAFSPGEKEVEWAIRCVIADEKAEQQGRGAWTLDGKMIDAPVSGKARAIVGKAEACGMDVGGLREKWKDQEPE